MPAEGVHFSALADSGLSSGAARVGAIFVDLPYFERFPMALLRYVLAWGPAASRWGDTTHHQAPIAVGRGLMEEAKKLGGEDGAWLYELALGYISHAAVNRSMHPHVNALASARAKRFGDTLQRQHQEVEKFQSILFHDARMGFEVMGTPQLHTHCEIDAGPLWKSGAVSDAVQRVLVAAWGEAPSRDAFQGWARGYSQYIALISSPVGRHVAPREKKEAERAELFPQFVERFEAAVAQSKKWIATLRAYGDDGAFDPSARAAFEREVPEGTIDPQVA